MLAVQYCAVHGKGITLGLVDGRALDRTLPPSSRARNRRAFAEKAVTPIYATCCAFAGDRGFPHPELTRSATSEEAHELDDQHYEKYLCSNRTCEQGMNLATGKDYESVIFLLEELTRPQVQEDASRA
jgi:D-lactate dehydrogenase